MVPESEIIFKISGSALSFLYYECDKSRSDQVGFLISEKHSFVKKTISDSQLNGEKNETIINISAVLPVSSPFLFCNNVGRVDRAKLKEILGSLEKDICGWYIFRRNSGLNPMLRGTILHRELLDALPHVRAQSFVLCCIGSDSNQSRSTHRFRHVFLLHKNGIFEPISVPIINLGQPEDGGYRTVAVSTSSNTCFNEIVSSVSLDSNLGGLAALKALQEPLQDKIMEIAAVVQRFDQRTQELMNEVQALKNNNLSIKCQSRSVAGKNNRHGVGGGDHGGEDEKFLKRQDDEKEEGEADSIRKDDKPEKKEDVEEKVDKDNESSEELVFSSQKIELPNPRRKKKFSSATSPPHPQNCEKIIIEESNSSPDVQNFSPSQEY